MDVYEGFEQGIGKKKLNVYAGGWKLNNVDGKIKDNATQMFIIDYINIQNSNELIKVMF